MDKARKKELLKAYADKQKAIFLKIVCLWMKSCFGISLTM